VTRNHVSRVAIPRSEVGSCSPTLRVRQKFPLRAASFRAPLPHVTGFPYLRVLRGHPPPQSMSFPGEGTPLMFSFPGDNLRGFPSSCVYLFVHATAYSELRQPSTSSHSRVASAVAVLSSRMFCVVFGMRYLPRRLKQLFRSDVIFQGTRFPLRPARFAVYASSCLFQKARRCQESSVSGFPLPCLKDLHTIASSVLP